MKRNRRGPYDEFDEEELIGPPPKSASACAQQVKAKATTLQLPAPSQLAILNASGASTLRACLQDLLRKHPDLAAEVDDFTASHQDDINASLREQQERSLTQLRALTDLDWSDIRISKHRREALNQLATAVRERVLQLSTHDLAASLDDVSNFMRAFRKNVPRETDLRADALVRASRAVESLMYPVWGKLLSAAEAAMSAKELNEHEDRAVACDVNGRLPLEGKLAERQLQRLLKNVAAASHRDELVKRFHAAATSLGHSYRLHRWHDEPAPPAAVQALADKVLCEMSRSEMSVEHSYAGDIADFDQAAYVQQLASFLNVDAEYIHVEVMGPSVTVQITVTVTLAELDPVTAGLEQLASEGDDTLSTEFGVTLESATEVSSQEGASQAERPTCRAALLQQMCRWDELSTLAASDDVSSAWVLREVMLPPVEFSNPAHSLALAAQRPQFCLGRAQQELQYGLLAQAVQQLRLLMQAGMMEALQQAWDEDDHEATPFIVQEHVNGYGGKIVDHSLGEHIAGWLECAKLACSHLDTSEAGAGGLGRSSGTLLFENVCSTLRDAAKESLDSEDEQKAMRDIVSVRHCDFEGRWYGSVWPGVFAAVDGVLDDKRPFDTNAMCRDHYM